MSAEAIIIIFTLVHIAVHLKWKKVNYKILYFESATLLTIGLASYALFYSIGILFTEKDIFRPFSPYFPLQPIDLIFIGLSLLLSTFLTDFLTKFFGLDRKSLLATLPWTITCQYRFLHELLWVFNYWVTADMKDIVNWIFGGKITPAFLTHTYALLFVLFTIFNFSVILQAFTKKH